MGNHLDLLKLLKEATKMKDIVSSQQEALAKKYYEADAGGGMVKAKVNGLMEVISLHAEKAALDTLGLDSLMELAAAAVNEALKRARESVKDDMMSSIQEMAGGLLNQDK